MSRQAVAWYFMADVAVFDREYVVDRPETLPEDTCVAAAPIEEPIGSDEDAPVPRAWLHAMGGHRQLRRQFRAIHRFARKPAAAFAADTDTEKGGWLGISCPG